MIVKSVKIHCDRIKDWKSFHDEFSSAFGFPDFYGRNMNAWIDCMTSIDSPDDGMTKIHCEVGGTITMVLTEAKDLKERCPEQYTAILECSAFVNHRRNEVGEDSVLCLSF